jgi:hypothetical protein
VDTLVTQIGVQNVSNRRENVTIASAHDCLLFIPSNKAWYRGLLSGVACGEHERYEKKILRGKRLRYAVVELQQ